MSRAVREPGQPRLRAECAAVARPCPFLRCRFHLDGDAARSCALDVADDGGHTLDELAEILGTARESVRLIEVAALRKLRVALSQKAPDVHDEAEELDEC